MTITIDQLMTPLSVDDAKTSIYNVLAALGVSTSGWKPGAVVRTIVAMTAVILSGASQVMVLLAKAGFRAYSVGDWLTLVADQGYNVQRQEASFATADDYTLTNTGGGVYSLDPGDLVLSYTDPQGLTHTYRNTTAVTVLGGTVPIPYVITTNIQADEAGSIASTPDHAITTMVTNLLGVTGTNPTALVGLDVEEDAPLRVRCDDKLDSLSPNAPSGAYSYILKGATRADGSLIGINRVLITPSGAYDGVVTVTVATASGAVSGSLATPGSDLYVANMAMQTQVVCIGPTALLATAGETVQNVNYTVWVQKLNGYDPSDDTVVITAINNAIAAWFSERPIGGDILPSTTQGYIFVDTLRGIIQGAVEGVVHATVATPATDTALTYNYVAVLGTTPAVNTGHVIWVDV